MNKYSQVNKFEKYWITQNLNSIFKFNCRTYQNLYYLNVHDKSPKWEQSEFSKFNHGPHFAPSPEMNEQGTFFEKAQTKYIK